MFEDIQLNLKIFLILTNSLNGLYCGITTVSGKFLLNYQEIKGNYILEEPLAWLLIVIVISSVL